jgi:hypothetical protein
MQQHFIWKRDSTLYGSYTIAGKQLFARNTLLLTVRVLFYLRTCYWIRIIPYMHLHILYEYTRWLNKKQYSLYVIMQLRLDNLSTYVAIKSATQTSFLLATYYIHILYFYNHQMCMALYSFQILQSGLLICLYQLNRYRGVLVTVQWRL